MIKMLSIGNSFSNNAQQWLHQMCDSCGIENETVNLYIGGCPLERHFSNIQSGEAAYSLEKNGLSTGLMADIKNTLLSENWDVITLQQSSDKSGLFDTYTPYITDVAEYVHKLCPNAKIVIHQTWAYELDSSHGAYGNYDHSQKKMYNMLCDCYKKASKLIGAEIIPCGDVIQHIRENVPEFDYQNGGLTLNIEDGFHLNHLYGCYIAGAVFLERVFGGNILACTFIPYENEVSADKKLIEILKNEIHKFLN